MSARTFPKALIAATALLITIPSLADNPEIVAYLSALTEDSVVRLRDLNSDGDFNDANEATQFFGPGNADGWPGVGSAQTILALGFDDVLAADGEESGDFETRIYRLRDLNGDGDAMDAGEATEFWDSMLPIGVNFDRPKDLLFGPDGALYMADNNTINFDYDTPEAIWRLEDLNADGDVNDTDEVSLYYELSPPEEHFGFICEDFKFDSTGRLLFSNQESSSNTGMIWIINPDLTAFQYADDTEILGLGFAAVTMTLHPETERPVMVGFDIFENRRIMELVDYNGNGYIDDNDEILNRYRSDLAAEPFFWNYQSSGPTDLDYAPDGSLWLLLNVDDFAIRFIDLNGDGDYNDENEAMEVYRATEAGNNGGFATTYPRCVTFAVVNTPGDMDCDGDVDFDDINPFVLALSGQAGYEAVWPDCRWLNGDVDGNGTVDFDDINPFVTLIGR